MIEPPTIREGIDAHLARVASHLAGLDAETRAEILRSVESQIHEALRHHAGDQPTHADLQAVLAGMDPPESYAAFAPPSGSSRARPLAATAVLAITLVAIVLCVVAMFLPPLRRSGPDAARTYYNAPWTLCLVFLACEAGAFTFAALAGQRTPTRLLSAVIAPGACLAAFAALAVWPPDSDNRCWLCVGIAALCAASFPLLLAAVLRHGDVASAVVAGTTSALGMAAALAFGRSRELPWLPFVAIGYFGLLATGAALRETKASPGHVPADTRQYNGPQPP
jgi:hypothetical protein